MSSNRRHRRVALPALMAACCCMGCPDPQPPPTDAELTHRIDAYLEPLIADRDLSGVALVGSTDAVRYLRAFGASDDATGAPNLPTTRFAIASLTKTFTAGATLIANDRGLLDLDDTLDRFGFEFPRASDITVRHLLLHSSGLANPDTHDEFEARIELDELLERIVTQPLQYEPGSQHRYSNAGYNVLAAVIERASGASYIDFLAEHIFAPLDLQATGHPTPDAPDVARGTIAAPAPAWRMVSPSADPSFSFGSGSLYATAPDTLLWARAVGAERLFTWREREWPYGWGLVEVGKHEGIEQTGATAGFMSSLQVYPDDGLFVVVLLNQEFGDWVPLGRDLAAIAFGESRAPRESLRPVELAADDLARCTGRFATEDRAVALEARDGHLWLYFDGWPIGKYLTPLSATEFAIRSDVGRIHFEAANANGFERLRWDYGDSDVTFVREP